MKSFTKTVTKTFEPLLVKFPVFKYDEQFVEIRSRTSEKFNKCFKCDREFKPNEEIGLACFKNVGNKVLCEQCSAELS